MKPIRIKRQGRPRVPKAKQLKPGTITLPRAYWDELRRIGRGNASKGVRIVLEAFGAE